MSNEHGNEGVAMIDIPREGVRLRVLKALAKDTGKELTTLDMCEQIIKTKTQAEQTSFAHLIKTKKFEPELTPDDLGTATIFVSHAWRYHFVQLVEAIELFAMEEPDFDEEKTFFWVDLIVNSQWGVAERPFDWWCNTFKSNVKTIGHTLLVLSPWKDPIPLTRAWCLFEILSTVQTEAKLTIQLSPSERVDF